MTAAAGPELGDVLREVSVGFVRASTDAVVGSSRGRAGFGVSGTSPHEESRDAQSDATAGGRDSADGAQRIPVSNSRSTRPTTPGDASVTLTGAGALINPATGSAEMVTAPVISIVI